MKPVLIEPLKKGLNINDLSKYGDVHYICEHSRVPEPSLFEVNDYKEWLFYGLPENNNFAFVIAGSTIKIGLMMSVLSDVYEEYDVLLFDSLYRRYVHKRIKHYENEDITTL